MLQYTTEQLSSIIAIPIIIILLTWTVAIFHKNRKKWGPYDILIVTILVLSILRNVTILSYTLLVILTQSDFDFEYCSVLTWFFNSIHTFQASSLASIAVIGLFSIKLKRKNQNLKTFLTPTHIIYHLFCLTTLCACVGVAAILAAQKDPVLINVFADILDTNPCNFLPFELDVKFNIFILVLHVFLAGLSLVSFLLICYNYCKMKQEQGFEYIKKSNSDLSDLSNNYHGINTNVNDSSTTNNRNYYDTYTIHKNDAANSGTAGNQIKDTWTNNSEVLSNISTTVSSTNSRRPCILRSVAEDDDGMVVGEEMMTVGLETLHPVLIVCYLFYHLPLIILCIYPKLIQPWPVAGIALWLGLVQDLLIPIGLGIVDPRFCKWVTNVYRCSSKKTEDKLPQVGLDGKFRPFGLTSPPQNMDVAEQHDRVKSLQAVEHRFPITNGSLYTSIDGRLPVIHNYRRHKDSRAGIKTLTHPEIQSSNVALHSTHLMNRYDSDPQSQQQQQNQHTQNPQKFPSCSNCETDLCPSHSNLHHLTPYTNHKLNILRQLSNSQNFVSNNPQNSQNSFQNYPQLINVRNFEPPKRLTQSQESISHVFCSNSPASPSTAFFSNNKSEPHIQNFNLSSNINNHMLKSSRNLLRINKMRLSRSEDSINDLEIEKMITQELKNKKLSTQNKQNNTENSRFYSSDEETVDFNIQNNALHKNYDSLSSNNSITTQANCDFEFFQNNSTRQSSSFSVDNAVNIVSRSDDNFNNYCSNSNNSIMSSFKPREAAKLERDKKLSKSSEWERDIDKNLKITRSSSKRSLDNYYAFNIDEEKNNKNPFLENSEHKIVLIQRSNSFMTLEDRKKRDKKSKMSKIPVPVQYSSNFANDVNNRRIDHFENNFYFDLSKGNHVVNKTYFNDSNNVNFLGSKVKSAEYIPNLYVINNGVFIEDIIRDRNIDVSDTNNNYGNKSKKYVGSSVPDFKKVFISEYI